MGFKIGDVIVGKDNNGYRWTGGGSISRVVSIPDPLGFITVELIKISTRYSDSPNAKMYEGRRYEVLPSRFELDNPDLENV